MSQGDLDCKVYVGDLPRDASERELEREFSVYGRLKNVWVARNPPGFAFIEFEDPRDADDAVRALDGKNVFGGRIRVEPSTGKSKPKPWQRPPPPPRYDGFRRSRPFDPNDKCFECGERGHYAYDCREYRGRRQYSRSRSRSRDRRRSYSPSRSRSRDRDYSRSRSPRKS